MSHSQSAASSTPLRAFVLAVSTLAISILAGSAPTPLLLIVAVSIGLLGASRSWGPSSLAALLILAPQIVGLLSVVSEVWVGKSNQPNVGLCLLVALAASLMLDTQRIFRSGTRSFSPGLFLLASFALYAIFRVSGDSFNLLQDQSSEPSEARLALAVFILLGAIVVAFIPDPSREAFLVTICVSGLVVGLLSAWTIENNPIWSTRPIALSVVAAASLASSPAIRTVLVGVGVAAFVWASILVGEVKDGPLLAMLLGLVVVMSTRTNPAVRLMLGTGAVTALLVWGSSMWRLADRDTNLSIRMEYWSSAVGSVEQHPILGAGFGVYVSPLGVYPHNVLIEIATTLGLLGLVLWLGVILNMTRACHHVRLMPLFLTSVLFAMVSGGFSGNAEYWMVGAFGLALTRSTTAAGGVPRAQLTDDPIPRTLSYNSASLSLPFRDVGGANLGVSRGGG